MKRFVFACLVIFLSFASIAKTSPAVHSAMDWLHVVDAGEYDKSWQQTGQFFQKQVSSTAWQQALNQVRTPLGAVTSREVLSAKEYDSLPGVPEGNYLVITLNTDFTEKPASVETITLTKTGDNWQPIGYFIK